MKPIRKRAPNPPPKDSGLRLDARQAAYAAGRAAWRAEVDLFLDWRRGELPGSPKTKIAGSSTIAPVATDAAYLGRVETS